MYFGPRSCHFSGSQHNLWSLQVFGGQERQSDGGVQHSVQRRRRRHHRQSLHAGVCEATFTDFYCLCLAPFPFVPTRIDSPRLDLDGRRGKNIRASMIGLWLFIRLEGSLHYFIFLYPFPLLLSFKKGGFNFDQPISGMRSDDDTF